MTMSEAAVASDRELANAIRALTMDAVEAAKSGHPGMPLGAGEIAATREALGWKRAPFEIPEDIREGWSAIEAGKRAERRWNSRFRKYATAFPAEAAEFSRRVCGELPPDFRQRFDSFVAEANQKAETIATRKASQNVLEAMTPGQAGNYIFYGVREFGMCAVMNGVSLHGGFIPYGGTFLVFSDYARNALRMAALMKIRAIYVLTHDSIGLGEDGPTHQPVEHAATLRLIPNLDVWRPCDTVESAVAWGAALERSDGPTALLLTRQNVPFQQRAGTENVARGGYVLAGTEGARAVIIATGSEVALAMGARKLLAEAGIPVRVVSMPCTGVFDRQPDDYKASVLPPGIPRIAVEAGVSDYWRKYVGLDGSVVGIDRFGESAPAADLYEHFGFTPENVARQVKRVLR